MTIVIMAVASVGMISALSFALKHQSDSMPQAKMVALAQAYFDEIMAKRYDENAPIGGRPACSATTTACSLASAFDDGESRAQYDDLDDFHGLDEQPPLHADGTPMSAYAGFRVQVSVRYPTAGQIVTLGVATATDAKIVDIQVSTPTGTDLNFTLVRANF